jgi:hypothetical protein
MTQQKTNSKNKGHPGCLPLLQVLCGLFFFVVLGRYYYRTLIDFWELSVSVLAIGTLFSIILLPASRKKLGKSFDMKGHFTLNMIFYGATIPAILLLLNYHVAIKESQTIQVAVDDSYRMRRGGRWIDATIHEKSKTLSFPDYIGAKPPSLIAVDIAKGWLGFYVVRDKRVIN